MGKPIKKELIVGISAITVVALYIAFQIFADILAIKIAMIGAISFTVGTLVYPFTFTLRDMIHKTLGKTGARRVIVLSGLLNLLMVGLFQLAILLPADPSWTIQNEFSIVLGSVWRIVIASIIAEIVSQLVDTEIYSFYVNKITKKHQWGRVLLSNLFSGPVDSILFVFIAFGGILPISVLWSIVGVQVIVKWAMAVVSIPGIYLVKDKEGVQM